MRWLRRVRHWAAECAQQRAAHHQSRRKSDSLYRRTSLALDSLSHTRCHAGGGPTVPSPAAQAGCKQWPGPGLTSMKMKSSSDSTSAQEGICLTVTVARAWQPSVRRGLATQWQAPPGALPGRRRTSMLIPLRY